MTEKHNLYELINKAKITQRDRFVLLLILSLTSLVNSFTALLLVKQLPDFSGVDTKGGNKNPVIYKTKSPSKEGLFVGYF